MVPAGRSARRDGGQRWLVVGLVFTFVVLLIDASIKSQSPAPTRQLAALAWVDRALVVVGQSNVEAAELTGFRRSTIAGLTADQVTADLAAVTSGADAAYRQLQSLREPTSLQAPAGLLDTCLFVRSQAAASISSAVGATLRSISGAPPAAAVQQFATAVGQLRIADQAYRLFVANLPATLGNPPPASSWVTGDGLYSAANLTVFLTALRSRINLVPVHHLSIVSFGTTPTPMGTAGTVPAVEVLPPSTTLVVTVIVGNNGNQEEANLTVSAALSLPARSSVRQSVDLAAGAVTAVQLAPLKPPLGPTVTLTVTVAAPPGEAVKPVIRTLLFQMPAPNAATTTTTVPGPTTTLPGPTVVTTVPGVATTTPAVPTTRAPPTTRVVPSTVVGTTVPTTTVPTTTVATTAARATAARNTAARKISVRERTAATMPGASPIPT